MKGSTFVIIFCVITIALFILFIILMQNINPPPIENTDNKTPVQRKKAFWDLMGAFDDDDFDDTPYPGLLKVKTIQIGTDNVLLKPTHTKTVNTTSAARKSTGEVPTNKTAVSASSAKGHRRSAGSNIEEKDIYVPISGTLILKILDVRGDTKVEIKFKPNPTNNNLYNEITNDERTSVASNESHIIVIVNITVIYNDDSGNKSHFTINEKDIITTIQSNSTNVKNDSLVSYVTHNVTDKIQAPLFTNVIDSYYKDVSNKTVDPQIYNITFNYYKNVSNNTQDPQLNNTTGIYYDDVIEMFKNPQLNNVSESYYKNVPTKSESDPQFKNTTGIYYDDVPEMIKDPQLLNNVTVSYYKNVTTKTQDPQFENTTDINYNDVTEITQNSQFNNFTESSYEDMTDNTQVPQFNNQTNNLLYGNYTNMGKEMNHTTEIRLNTIQQTDNNNMLPLKVVFNNETEMKIFQPIFLN